MKDDNDAFMRKTPSQKRANVTVDNILEATAQILEQGNDGLLTTNHIAERAGYSVGTLYDYFPNKQSLLRAIALREMHRQEKKLTILLQSLEPDHCDADIIRIIIRAAMRPFGNRRNLRIRLMQFLMRDDAIAAATKSVQDHVVDLLIKNLAQRNGHANIMSDIHKYILISSVSGAVQNAIIENPDLLNSTEFEDGIIHIIFGFLDRIAHTPKIRT
jgi:AcrR family transcriptional regulator